MLLYIVILFDKSYEWWWWWYVKYCFTPLVYEVVNSLIDVGFAYSMSSKVVSGIVRPTSNYFDSSHYWPVNMLMILYHL